MANVQQHHRKMKPEATLKDAVRIRNLLAATVDSSLPHICQSVLPACLERLDQVSVVLFDPARQSEEDRLLFQQVQGHTIGALAHAIQRLRNIRTDTGTTTASNLLMNQQDATKGDHDDDQRDSWTGVVLDICCCLRQLQSSISITLAITLLEVGIPRASPVTPCLPPLITFLDARFREANSPEGNSQKLLNTTSWVVLDALANIVRMTPFQDWDRQSYGGGQNPPWKNCAPALQIAELEASRSAMDRDGSGMFDLLVDMVLFWPVALSHRRRDTIDNSTGLSVYGLARMNHRCKEDSVWDEIYLRHLKYACTMYALGEAAPIEQSQGLLQQASDRAIVFAVLAAATNSMHGRLAFDFVGRAIGPHAFDEYRTTSAQTTLSWGVAITLLLFIHGHQKASLILKKYPSVRPKWETIVGPWPGSPKQYRSPLAPDDTRRVISFLQYNMDSEYVIKCIDSDASPGMGLTDENNALAATLYLELAAKVQDPSRNIFGGIDLLSPLFHRISTNTRYLQRKTVQTVSSILLQTAVAALESLPPSRIAFPEEGMVRDNTPLPLGVPEDYSNRDDINEILCRHRERLKRCATLSPEAIETRATSYRMIAGCFQCAGMPEDNPLAIPTALFQRATSEDRSLLSLVVETLNGIKMHFVSQYASGLAGMDLVSPLVPGLICAVTSGLPGINNTAMEWSNELISKFDPELASLMFAFANRNQFPEQRNTMITGNDHAKFLDIGVADGKNEVLRTIMKRVRIIGDTLKVSSQIALALLIELNFEIDSVVEHYEANPFEALQAVGMLHRARWTNHQCRCINRLSNECCRICLSSLGSESKNFALPCEHRFCHDCWKQFLSLATSQGSQKALRITCPDHECHETLSIFEVEAINKETAEKLCEHLISAFVDVDCEHSVCPRDGCNIVAVREKGSKSTAVTCHKCNQHFCFDCGRQPHEPAHCQDITKWNEFFGSSSFWIKKHARPCPSCGVHIERSGGCNHIRCRQCGADWCWMCLSYLRSHMEPHVCNSFDPSTDENGDDEKRSIFFSERFQAHEDAADVAEQRANFVMDHETNIKESLWYANEADIDLYLRTFPFLARARSFLKYSYVTAWRAQEGTSEKDFHAQQAILELSTEKLTRLSMQSLDGVYSTQKDSLAFMFRSMRFHWAVMQECMSRLKSFC